MPAPELVLRAIHAKTKETATLQLRVGQQWEVGRQCGTERIFRWNIEFDPALSRDHFRADVQPGTLIVEARNNRHPLIFEGQSREKFEVQVGQRFITAHTVFHYQKSDCAVVSAGQSSTDLDIDLDILSVTKVFAILFQSGATFGKIFYQLQSYQSAWLSGPLGQIEKDVTLNGYPLSKALAQHSHLFSPSYLGTVELGESTDIARAFKQLARQLGDEYRQSKIKPSDQVTALALACRNVAEVIRTGQPPLKAIQLAGKASHHEGVSKAFLALEVQLQTQPNLADCKFPPMFLSLFPALLAAHQSVGNAAGAFQEFAELLQSP